MENVDHYSVLGLPSGEEGSKLTEKEISKAYKLKALELHPDKRPDDPNAHTNFQKLKSSYEVLKDEKARKLFDDLLRVKRDQIRRHSEQDAKRRKMVSDLEAREAAAFEPDSNLKAKREEERIARQLKVEIERIRAMHKGKVWGTVPPETTTRDDSEKVVLDKEKVLKVSWEKIGDDYSCERLREIFSKFGKVEDIVMKRSRKKGSALVVMSTKDEAIAANGNFSGNLSNPLLVLPLQPVVERDFPSAPSNVDSSVLDNLVGAGFKAYEERILEKLQKAAQNKS